MNKQNVENLTHDNKKKSALDIHWNLLSMDNGYKIAL